MHDDHQPHYSNQWENSDKVQLSISGNNTLAQVVTNLWYILSVRLPCSPFLSCFFSDPGFREEKKKKKKKRFSFSLSFFFFFFWRLWGTDLIVSSFFLLIIMGNLPTSDGAFSFFNYNVFDTSTHFPRHAMFLMYINICLISIHAYRCMQTIQTCPAVIIII